MPVLQELGTFLHWFFIFYINLKKTKPTKAQNIKLIFKVFGICVSLLLWYGDWDTFHGPLFRKSPINKNCSNITVEYQM